MHILRSTQTAPFNLFSIFTLENGDLVNLEHLSSLMVSNYKCNPGSSGGRGGRALALPDGDYNIIL